MMPHVSAEFLARVEAMVRGGGVWICAPATGTRTAEHTIPFEDGLGGVAEFAGVEAVFSYPATGTDAVGEALGLSAPLAGWCSALRPRGADTRVVGKLKTKLVPGGESGWLTERTLGGGAVVVIGAQPQGEPGRGLLEKIVEHYAVRAGVMERYEVSPGTLVCPRVNAAGKKSWIVVNMDGVGGEARVKGKLVKVAGYEWRGVQGAGD
jgi:beta-galactosidase